MGQQSQKKFIAASQWFNNWKILKKSNHEKIYPINLIQLYPRQFYFVRRRGYLHSRRTVCITSLFIRQRTRLGCKYKNAVPLTVADSVGEPINDAQITLFKNDVAYTLVSCSDTGTYHYPGDDLTIKTGDVFSIEALVSDKAATGETAVPESPDSAVQASERL